VPEETIASPRDEPALSVSLPGENRHLATGLALSGIVAAATALVLYGLDRFPVTGGDEVFFAEPARALAKTGSLTSPIFFNIAGLDYHFFIQPPVYFLFTAGAYRLLGFNETVARLGSAVPYLAGILVGFFLIRSISTRIGLSRQHAAIAGLLGAGMLAFNQQSIQMARGGRPDLLAVLLVFLGWLIVDRTRQRQSSTRRAAHLTAGFAVMQLAGLTHPALAAPAAGITLATIVRPSWLGIPRRTAVSTGLAGAGLVMLPYAIWVMPHFSLWRIQFFDVIIEAGSGKWGNFLSTQTSSFTGTFKYEPAIVILVIFSLAAFPWRTAPDVMGAVTGIGLVAVASSRGYFFFLVFFTFIPAATGIVVLATATRKAYRRLAVALTMLAALNCILFSLVRAYTIHQFYRQSGTLVTENIERFVPHGAHLIGVPSVYFATLADDAEFREYQLLTGVIWPDRRDYEGQFRRSVEQYQPTWFALPPAMDPYREYCYLPVRFRRVSAVDVQVAFGHNVASQSSVAYTLWKAYPGRAAGC
jgi:4-amino-4-deoxy-L-arabinose transferase-like glycosyltransferase